MLKRVIVVAVMIIVPVLTHARVETWVDDQGVTHHSNVSSKNKAAKGSESNKDSSSSTALPPTNSNIDTSVVVAPATVDTPSKTILPTSPIPVVLGASPKLRSPVGTNLTSVEYWTTQLPFLDVMKTSSEWGSSDGQPLDVDANGWIRSLQPGQVANVLLMRDTGGRYPSGQYVVRYRGEGSLKLLFDAQVVSQQAGQMIVQVTPSEAGIRVQIESTNPANYIRDIQIIMPGGICQGDIFTHVDTPQACSNGRFMSYADNVDGMIFYPVFLNRLKNYSVLRFVDWMKTNSSVVTAWSQRTLPSYRTWTAATGVPIEIMIALANSVGAHPWFNIPHQTDDSYSDNFARLVNSSLAPSLGVYVEYSDETWNWAFPQASYVNQQGLAQGIERLSYSALRTRTIGQYFRQALGPTRVVTVLGAQAAVTDTATIPLDYLQARFGSTGIDALAIAPYISLIPGPAEAGTYTGMSLTNFSDYVRTSLLPAAIMTAMQYRKVADHYGLHLITYEGGQHMVGSAGAENNDALTQLFISFNRDPAVRQLYLDYLANWRQAGGELFMHYSDVGRYGKYGSWGSLEYISQTRDTAPKYDALQSFIEQNPVWWSQ